MAIEKSDGATPSDFFAPYVTPAVLLSGRVLLLLLYGEQLFQHVSVVFAYGMPRRHFAGAVHTIAALADCFSEVIYFDNLARNISNSQFHNLHFFDVRNRHIVLQPLPNRGHIVFGGNDCSAFVDRCETGTLVVIDPLFERFDAPRFGVVEKVVQRADRLRERNDKCFVIHRAIIYRFSYSATGRVCGGTPPKSERRTRTIRRPCGGNRIGKTASSSCGRRQG